MAVSRIGSGPPLGTFRFRADGLDANQIRLSPGEVVGLAGVVGSGRSRVPAVLFGLAAAIRRLIRIANQEAAGSSAPDDPPDAPDP